MPAIFQKLVNKYFGDIPGLTIYFEDLCIATNTREENDEIISQVMERAKRFNIKFNFWKFQYCLNKIKYLGVIFGKDGMLPDPAKIEAIKSLDIPKNKNDLQRLLGMVNYLRNFIPNLSSIISPIRDLLKKDVKCVVLPQRNY